MNEELKLLEELQGEAQSGKKGYCAPEFDTVKLDFASTMLNASDPEVVPGGGDDIGDL